MTRKSGSVTVRLLASVALALAGCSDDPKRDEEKDEQQQSGHVGGYGSPIYYGGGGGSTGLRANPEPSRDSITRGGFGSTGSTRSVYT